jgi:CDP-diacylglycerol--glycerol-3-phosphate 3-phosphatidyltransferase
MNLANALTLSRILVVPIIALLLMDGGFWPSFIAAVLFIIASITDWLDGYLARAYHMESNLGKLLDPLADKILIVAVLVFLIPLGRAPAWMAAVIIIRELVVTGVRAIAAERQIIIAANWLGKYKTAFQIAACIPLLFPSPFLTAQMHTAGLYFLWIATFFAVWSGWDYVYDYFRQAHSNSAA